MSDAQLLVAAVMGLLFGPALAIWPYKLAKWSEQLYTRGRKPAGQAKLTAWRVVLNRVSGILLTITGIYSIILYLS